MKIEIEHELWIWIVAGMIITVFVLWGARLRYTEVEDIHKQTIALERIATGIERQLKECR